MNKNQLDVMTRAELRAWAGSMRTVTKQFHELHKDLLAHSLNFATDNPSELALRVRLDRAINQAKLLGMD